MQVDVSFEEYSLERAAEAGADVLFVATGFREGLYRRLRDEAEVPPRTHDEPCHAPSHAPAMSCYALAARLARAQPNPTIHDLPHAPSSTFTPSAPSIVPAHSHQVPDLHEELLDERTVATGRRTSERQERPSGEDEPTAPRTAMPTEGPFARMPESARPAAAIAVVAHFEASKRTPEAAEWLYNFEPFDWTLQARVRARVRVRVRVRVSTLT